MQAVNIEIVFGRAEGLFVHSSHPILRLSHMDMVPKTDGSFDRYATCQSNLDLVLIQNLLRDFARTARLIMQKVSESC